MSILRALVWIPVKTLFPWLRLAAFLAMSALLPFFTLVRGAVYFYHRGFAGYAALLFASLLTMALLLVYFIVVDRWLSRRVLLPLKYKFAAVVLAVLAFNVYALFMFSNDNAKTADVALEFHHVHPLLRIAVNTVSYFDKSVLVTDMSRDHSDYAQMGMSPFERSLHFAQADGYVHAVDIRTVGRFGLHNWMIERVFRVLGFATLRHVGTADHLHIALPRPKVNAPAFAKKTA